MTFGEKLKELRKESRLTQEELAEKLNVSRQAVAKWENGKGLPDIENIKSIASLFDKSVDFLLDNHSESVGEPIVTESVDFNGVKKSGKSRNREDEYMKVRFAGASQIYALTRRKKLSKAQNVLDFFIGAGTAEIIDIAGTGLVAAYLVQKNGKEIFAVIQKGILKSRPLTSKFENKRVIDGYIYKKCYELL